MLLLSTYQQNLLPVSGLRKVGDLLNYDGPILSLFKDESGQFYLFYWVDNDDSTNRWLVWKVKEENLYFYLNGESSLRDLLLVDDKDYIFSVDISDELVYTNVYTIELKKIPTEYLPEIRSFYKLSLPSFAKELIEQYEVSDNYYKFLMRQKSIVFNISPTNLNFARAVTTQDAGSFLSKLTRSLTGFIEENFWEKYKDIISSATDYNRFLNEAKAILSPRLFGLRYGSFEVLVGIDIIKKINLENFSDWQHNLLPAYERDVVDVDYNDVNQLREIAQKYSDSAREKIYDPYIKIINNPHYEFTVKDKQNKIIRLYHKLDKSNESIVLPPKKTVEQELARGKKFISMVVEIQEGQDVTEINKRLLQSGLLFSQQLDELALHLEYVKNDEITIYFKSPMLYKFSFVNNVYTAYVEDLGLYLENADKSLLLINLNSEIISLYRTSISFEQDDSTKLYFNKMIDHIVQNTSR